MLLLRPDTVAGNEQNRQDYYMRGNLILGERQSKKANK